MPYLTEEEATRATLEDFGSPFDKAYGLSPLTIPPGYAIWSIGSNTRFGATSAVQ